MTLAAALPVVCTVDLPVVSPDETAMATVLADVDRTNSLKYEWTATGGALQQTDKSSVEWNPKGANTGSFTLSVKVTDSAGSSGSCSVAVMVGSVVREAPSSSANVARQIRTDLLLNGQKEADNFGLYSYMLLGSRPNPSNQERYQTFFKAFTDTVAAYNRLTEILPRAQLNIVYIPVLGERPARFDVQWILDHYDYDRALKMLGSIPGVHTGDGPYIVSTPHPLEGAGHEPDKYLVEDLSTVPVTVVKFWVNQFRAQTAQERWNRTTLSGVALRIRTAIEIAAIAYPEVRSSISALIAVK